MDTEGKNEKVLHALYDAYVKSLKAELKEEPTAAVLETVRKFLGDNNINATGMDRQGLKNIADELPTFDDPDPMDA